MMRIPGPREAIFRISQEAANLRDYLLPLRGITGSSRFAAPFPALPDPEKVAGQLRGTPFAGEIARLAAEIRAHRLPIFGSVWETGPEIDWRCDYPGAVSTGLGYFRRIPYLDPAQVGDHKNVWEINRHQHLVVLAQDHLLHGNRESLDTIGRHLESWWQANLYLQGINWTSALEVAFRALSWLWVYHLAGPALSGALQARLIEGLRRHGRFLAHNLSVYFSPNTHLLGEAVVLHAIGTLLPALPEAAGWRNTGRRIVLEQMPVQVRPDGGYFEQSAYYHVYAVDMFLFHALLEEPPQEYRDRLRRMGELLRALLGPDGRIPLIGDDDGGRFFYPYGRRDEFGRATLATLALYLGEVLWPVAETEVQAAWWIGCDRGLGANPASVATESAALFPDTGLAFLRAGDWECILDFGPFGPGSGGHSHADTLSLLLRRPGEEVLVDAGTYTYVGNPAERNRFRGTALHNTIRIGGQDQAAPAGPFRWQDPPESRLIVYQPVAEGGRVAAECRYRGYTHRRTLELDPGCLTVTDEIEGPGSALIEQFWHFGVTLNPESGSAYRAGSCGIQLDPVLQPEHCEGGEFGWRSQVLGEKQPAPYLRGVKEIALPARIVTRFDLSTNHDPVR